MDEEDRKKEALRLLQAIKDAILISEGTVKVFIAACPFCPKQVRNVSKNSVTSNILLHVYSKHKERAEKTL